MLPAIIRRLFKNQYGHFRGIWRFVFYALIVFGAGAAYRWAVGFVSFPDEGDALLTWKALVSRSGQTVILIGAAFVVLRWIDRRPIALLGMSMRGDWKRDFGLGVFFGITMISLTLTILWLGGWMTLSLNDITPALLRGISSALALFFVAALMEELMLRGYPLQVFIEGSRKWIAVILLSSVFSIIHLDNPDASIPSSLNIFLAGVLLSVSYLKTRSLWLPTGLHLGWNWMQASFWGMGVSGYHVKWSVFAAEAQGAIWISGGKFGAEASIFATLVLLISIYLIWTSKWFSVAEELETQWRRYPQGFRLPPADDDRVSAPIAES